MWGGRDCVDVVVTEGVCSGETGDLSEGERQPSEWVTGRLLGSGNG